MFSHVTTLTDFILEEERKIDNATGSLTLLLVHIENATKIIASHVAKSGLVDILGSTGTKNTFNEEVQKLDTFSNDLLVKTLLSSGQVFAVASEELPDFVYPEKHSGEYIVFLDPLDGSSNIDTNAPIGTIFSVYKKGGERLLQKGKDQIAAGYVIYGSSTMFVYSSGSGVNGFTLDPSIGSFLLSHPDIKIPEKGNIYSINEGNERLFDRSDIQYLSKLKDEGYKARYIGTMVADVHRTLFKGGIFLYPKDSKNPDGKLRLVFEVNPMSFLIHQAGGLAVSNGLNPLEIVPTSLTDRVPIALGSAKNVEEYMSLSKPQ